jgi:hypothetical protein
MSKMDDKITDKQIIEMLQELFKCSEEQAYFELEYAKDDELRMKSMEKAYYVYSAMKRLPNAKEEIEKTSRLVIEERKKIREKREDELFKGHSQAVKKPLSKYDIN